MKRSTLKADSLLLLAAVIWGAAFVGQRAAMEHIGPLMFNVLRFALGTIVLLPVIALRSAGAANSQSESRNAGSGVYLHGGLLAGLLLFFGAGLQQFGMVHTPAGKAGFITGLYVVLVPIFGLFVGQRTAATTWGGMALALAGLYFLSVTKSFDVNRGDLLVLGCAVVWAVHVLIIAWLAPQTDPLKLAAVQFAVVALMSFPFALLRETTTISGLRASVWPILYCGAISVGIAYTLQVVGQRDAPPAHAAILLSFEAVFAAVSGYLLLHERFGRRELLGCGLMLAGIIVSQVRAFSRSRT